MKDEVLVWLLKALKRESVRTRFYPREENKLLRGHQPLKGTLEWTDNPISPEFVFLNLSEPSRQELETSPANPTQNFSTK